MSKANQCVNVSPYYFSQRKTPTQSSLSRKKDYKTSHLKKTSVIMLVSAMVGPGDEALLSLSHYLALLFSYKLYSQASHCHRDLTNNSSSSRISS